MDLEARRLRLESAGLVVLDEAWSGAGPAPMRAWRPIISGGATPAARVRILEANRHLSEVQDQWEGIAEGLGLFGDKDEFLISVAGVGAANAPWAYVRRAGPLSLAQRIGSVEGGPEFVAMSLSGHVVCGVTTEEYEVWIVTESIE